MPLVTTVCFLMIINLPFRLAFRNVPTFTRLRLRSALNGSPPNVVSEGNYAGLLASFHPKTGALVPLPDYYIPDALKEWGQIPTTLEVLTSSFERVDRLQTIVLPETGCGIDNLETIMGTYSLQPMRQTVNDDPMALGYLVTGPKDIEATYFEAAFPHLLPDDTSGSIFRCRVAVPIENSSKPINMIIERRVEEVKNNLKIADTTGGGLDGQSVARWLGKSLNSASWRAFAENSPRNDDPASLSLPLGVRVERQNQMLTISKQNRGSISLALDSTGFVSTLQT